MRAMTCEQESRILRALASGRAVDPDVQAHLDACEVCREAAAVSRIMQDMAITTGETRPLPDPALLWWKAQLLRRWEAERHVAAPIERMHRVELLAGIVGLVLVVVWQWADLRRAFGALSPSNLSAWTTTAGTAHYLPAALLGTVLLAIFALAGLHRKILES